MTVDIRDLDQVRLKIEQGYSDVHHPKPHRGVGGHIQYSIDEMIEEFPMTH